MLQIVYPTTGKLIITIMLIAIMGLLTHWLAGKVFDKIVKWNGKKWIRR
jgi:hypothetical protein